MVLNPADSFWVGRIRLLLEVTDFLEIPLFLSILPRENVTADWGAGAVGFTRLFSVTSPYL